jgi:hypothetical protein
MEAIAINPVLRRFWNVEAPRKEIVRHRLCDIIGICAYYICFKGAC